MSIAEIPEYINYQGKLTDGEGSPIADGDYSVIFAIWDEENEGDQLWGNDINVTVVNGLFTVALGPIEDNIFSTGVDRWLSIDIGGEGELGPRVKLTSSPYAFHALRADSAYHVAGAADCGWIRDSRGVKLKVPGDSVGIGVAMPSVKLDVEGDIKTSDTLFANNIKLGSLIEDGRFNLYGNNSADRVISMSEMQTYGGGSLILYEDNGVNFSGMMEMDVSDGGGGFLLISSAESGNGFVVDGNYTPGNNPVVGIYGTDRSVIFNLNESGDDAAELPYSAISSSEIWNEAGVANSFLSTNVALSSGPTKILTRKMWFPTSGYAVVTANVGFNFWHAYGTIDQIRFGISDVDGVLPYDHSYFRNYTSAWNTFNFSDNMSVQRYFSVSEGLNTFYLMGEFIGNTSPNQAAVNIASMTVMFFPTWRGYLEIPDKADVNAMDQYELDLLINDHIETEKEELRKEFEAKLDQFKKEMDKQLEK